ncbi:MAG: hypothetical protein CMD57_00995 [Gammaproteobacteria bacterium]|nr:hypothetical protein [Gammaproteobacteria bacterium]|tara:strand:- start:9495 stop:10148 length:654 start_codon:yes stop_codon:yes gene_type:complete
MASTFTASSGLEKPGSGEQAGSWGETVNNNFDIIDRVSSGFLSLTLSSTSSTITATDGTPSDGHYKVLFCTGSLSSLHTVTIAPNNKSKLYLVNNATTGNQSVKFQQGGGSGTTVTIAAGVTAWIYADGSGSNANVRALSTELVNDLLPRLGADLDVNGNDILMGNQSVKFGTSKWEIVLDTGDNDLLFKYNNVTVFKLSSTGAVVAKDNITAFGSP